MPATITMSHTPREALLEAVGKVRPGASTRAFTFGPVRGSFDGEGFDVLCEVVAQTAPSSTDGEVCVWGGAVRVSNGCLVCHLFGGTYTTNLAEADRVYADKVRRLNL